ncbi:MAG: SGNH/GDSL hydrolase family protein [Candidatus Methylacidiphilales bacterium]
MANATQKAALDWYNPRDWGIEGKGWTSTHRYYDRLPIHAEGKVTPAVWRLSRSPTGFHTFFETDAPEIHAKWLVRDTPLNEANMSQATFSGLDLYAWDETQWRWAGVAQHFKYTQAEVCLINNIPGQRRKWLLYSPLRNPLVRLQIGVPAGAAFQSLPGGASPNTPAPKPIAYYGSSIVHGAFASRPGMVHTSILGRMLGRSIINLGFSGSARMEEAVAELLAELDVDLFMIDPLPNMHTELVQERAEKFLRILCAARPDVPVLLVEDFPVTNAWIKPDTMRHHRAKWAVYRQAYEKVRDDGVGKLSYLAGEELIGTDNEGTLDCIHPNDYGYMNMARYILPSAKEALASVR